MLNHELHSGLVVQCWTCECEVEQTLNFFRHDIAATCMLKMPLNPNHPSILLLLLCTNAISVCHSSGVS